MKKAVQKTKSPLYFRYEFSDEKGRLEGGDIFEFSTVAKLQKLMSAVLDVAESDAVTVNLTIGKDDTFFKFLKNVGLTQKEINAEMVDASMLPALEETKAPKTKKAAASKKAPKAKKATKKARSAKSA